MQNDHFIKLSEENLYILGQSNKQILADILKGILNYVPIKEKNDFLKYEAELQKKLKFKNIDDYKLLRACIDIIEDSSSAINEYEHFGLGKNDRYGESYLRLYGVLNSIYQQIGAIVELAELFNFPNKKEVISELKKLKVSQVRNKLAAHTVNFRIDNGSKASKANSDFFRLAMTSVRGWGENLLVISNQSSSEQINLKQEIQTYQLFSDKLLFKILDKSVHSIFPNPGRSKNWLIVRLKVLESRIA